jgi:2-polyprenyl-3-methyl-5-hydroxy-6-metoxy-1,4-benzoquinol methylase
MRLLSLPRVLQRMSRLHRGSSSTWAVGIDHEVSFWDSYLKTGGLESKSDYRRRFDPDEPLAPFLCPLLDHVEDDPARVLDVGAGPLTTLGKKHPTKRLAITATDALASQYDRLLETYGLNPPVRTINVAAEALSTQFAKDTFHLATAFNCLDHAIDPMDAIRQMVSLVKPSCYVYLCHVENEGQNQNYLGLHQWNFTLENGDFIIRNRRGAINMTRALGSSVVVNAFRDDGSIWGAPSSSTWLHVAIRKTALPPSRSSVPPEG